MLVTLAVPVWADENADANRLFVQTMQAWKQAEQINGDSLEQAETRLELLKEIEINLSRIVDQLSSSDLAVQLLLGPVGPLSLDRMPALIEDAEGLLNRSSADYIASLAKKKLQAGDISAAREKLAVAMEKAQASKASRDRDLVLSSIAALQVSAGDSIGALETIHFISVQYLREERLQATAFAQFSEGDVAGSLETLSLIENIKVRLDALQYLAETQLQAGDATAAGETLSLAFKTAQKLDGSGYFIYEKKLRAIAERLERVGMGEVFDLLRKDLATVVKDCWVVQVDTPAAKIPVTVYFEIDRSGRVLANSLRRVESEDGEALAIEIAFQGARRAILRCQGEGYPHPSGIEEQQAIEMTFDPTKMEIYLELPVSVSNP